jgi:hypothetical protein
MLKQWGFSYEWLFVVAVTNSAWLVGMWIIWFDCDVNSELCKKGRRLGLWRTILDLADALREDLGPNTCGYSDEELAQVLARKPPIKYYMRVPSETEPGYIGLSSRKMDRIRLHWGQDFGRKNL